MAYVDLLANNCVSWKKFSSKQKNESIPLTEDQKLEKRLEKNRDHNNNGGNPLASVISRIEKLYGGACASESDDGEDIANAPVLVEEDGNAGKGPKGKRKKRSFKEDEYDPHDEFIDDSEIVQFYDRNGNKTKHQGFFINKGTLDTQGDPRYYDDGKKSRDTISSDEFRPKKTMKKKLGSQKKAQKTKVKKVQKASEKLKTVESTLNKGNVKSENGLSEKKSSAKNPPVASVNDNIQETKKADAKKSLQKKDENEKDKKDRNDQDLKKDEKEKDVLTPQVEVSVSTADTDETVDATEVVSCAHTVEVPSELGELLHTVDKLARTSMGNAELMESQNKRKNKRLPTPIRDKIPDLAKFWAIGETALRKHMVNTLMPSLDPFIEEASLKSKLSRFASFYRASLSSEVKVPGEATNNQTKNNSVQNQGTNNVAAKTTDATNNSNGANISHKANSDDTSSNTTEAPPVKAPNV